MLATAVVLDLLKTVLIGLPLAEEEDELALEGLFNAAG